MTNLRIPCLVDIEEAYERIREIIHLTPVLSSTGINNIVQSELFFKCENFQKVGAFKFRGAVNAVMQLSKQELANGVVTHSSGNHAAALALAAKINGVKAYIVMPHTSPEVKKAAVASYDAALSFCEPNQESRTKVAAEIMERTGATFVHPYDDFNIICGQGTSALELLKDYPDLDIVVCPVGGGGLLSGTLTAVKGLNPDIKVYAAEPEGADDCYRSFGTGNRISFHEPDTIADGLLMTLSELTYQIINDKLDDIFLANDTEIIESMLLTWERMKIVIEPSSAVCLAVIRKNPEIFRDKKVGVILSGGNIDLLRLPF